MALAASRCALLVLLGSLALAGVAESQFLWLDRADGDVVSVESYKPLFRGDGQPFAASATLLGARKVFLGGRLALVADVPIAHARVARYEYQYSDTGPPYLYRVVESMETEIASPYLGIERPGAWVQEVGVRIDLGRGGAVQGIGTLAELERGVAFGTGASFLRYGVAYRPPRESGVHWSGRVGVMIPLSRGGSHLISYRGMLDVDRHRFRLGVGLVGIAGEGGSSNQLEAFAEAPFGAWRPALHARRWIDTGLEDAVTIVLGLRLEWRPPGRVAADQP